MAAGRQYVIVIYMEYCLFVKSLRLGSSEACIKNTCFRYLYLY